MKTPCYIFDSNRFHQKAALIKSVFGDMDLTFSIKANPFLLTVLPDVDVIRHVEVCSPGELAICKKLGVPGDRIIYSGVMKEEWDVAEAVSYGADILTAESKGHFELICREGEKSGKRIKVLLRLSSGNQFGMSGSDIMDILSSENRENAEIIGLHYYSGTAKNKLKQIEKDLAALRELLSEAEKKAGYVPSFTEYGPGLSAEYFEEPYEEKDQELLNLVSGAIKEFAAEYRTGIEMGRFLAAPAGRYFTTVKDIKSNGGVNYVICDGGVHQVKYFGQNMGMKVPPVMVLRDGVTGPKRGKDTEYCIAGSLCTTADVLVRNITLPELRTGDILCFDRTGAYAVSEGALAFLSRNMPEIWIDDGERRLLRNVKESWKLNCPE
ncbi:MAG: alanine racemase [Lachnospiraceae bacterium]|nr:alanine racemase [Lachnospiraceae bacterium]